VSTCSTYTGAVGQGHREGAAHGAPTLGSVLIGEGGAPTRRREPYPAEMTLHLREHTPMERRIPLRAEHFHAGPVPLHGRLKLQPKCQGGPRTKGLVGDSPRHRLVAPRRFG